VIYVVGVDGCSGGWIAASQRAPGADIQYRRVRTLEDLFADTVTPAVVAVDVPIGLLERGARECDVKARRLLGPRRSSVFTAPIRPMLTATSQAEASRLRRRLEVRAFRSKRGPSYRRFRKSMTSCAASPAGARSFAKCIRSYASSISMASGR
jgi:predicted RNase H-like nuclease